MTTNFRFEWQDLGAGERRTEFERQSAERAKDTTLWGALNAAVETDSMVANIVRQAGGPEYDPNYIPDATRIKAKMLAANVPEDHAKYITSSVSEADEDRRIEEVRTRMSAEQYLGDAGYTGAAMRVAVGMLDPASLALNAVPMGWAVKGGGVAAAVKMGLAVGTMNAGQEAVLAMSSPTHKDPSEIAAAGLAGFAMGAPIGGVLGMLYNKAAHGGWLSGTLKSVKRTPQGDKALAAAEAATARPVGTIIPKETPRLPPPYRKVEGELLDPEAPGWQKAPDAPEREPIEGEFTDVTPKALPAPKDLPAPDAPAAAPEAPPAAAADEVADVADDIPEEGLGLVRVGDEVTFDVKGREMAGMVTEELPNGDFLVETTDGKVRRVSLEDLNLEDELEGGFIAGGSIGSGQRVLIEDPSSFGSFIKIPGTNWRIPVRFDLAAHFDRWGEDNPLWRKLGRAIVDDPGSIKAEKDLDGNPIYHANQTSVSEYAEMEKKASLGRQMKLMYAGYDEYAKRMGLGKNKFDPRVEKQFFEDVGRVFRDPDGELARANPEMLKLAQEISAENRATLARLKKVNWKGAENIEEKDFWLMKKWDHDKVGRFMVDPEMKKRVYQVVANAIIKARPDLEVERATRIGKHFVDKLRALRSGAARHMGMLDDQGKARLAELLRQGDVLDDSEVDDILEWVYGMDPTKGDAGQIARLKKRTLMDDTHFEEWVDADGVKRRLSISDLLVNDVRELQSQYVTQMSAAYAFAKKGYRSLRDIQNAIEEAVAGDEGLGLSAKAIAKRRSYIEGSVRHIFGQGFIQSDGAYSNTERFFRGIRNTNFIQYMGQVGLASLPEYGHIAAMHTIRAMENIPAYKGILKMAKEGKLPKDLLRDLEDMGAVLDEGLLHQPIWRDVTGDSMEQFTKGFENITGTGANYVARLSGIQKITTWQRRSVAKLYSKRLIDMAVKGDVPEAAIRRRLATNGIDENDIEDLFSAIRKYTETDGKDIVGIDYVAWEGASPRTYDLFRSAIHKEAYRSIQEVTLGSTPPWMHSEFGKLLMQFRSFAMTAWVKQSMHGLAHFDLQTVLTWMFSMGIAGPVYAAQTAVNYAGDQEKLRKRLTPEKIALAAFQRAGFSSLVPGMIDTITGFTMDDPIFSHARGSNLGTGFITGNPTVSTFGKALQLGSAGAQQIFTDDAMFLRKDAQAVAGIVPNLYGIRSLLNTWAADFPNRNYLRQYQED